MTRNAVVPADLPRAEPVDVEYPAAPKIGKWYWVKDDDVEGGRWFGCVTHVGTNYAEMHSVVENGTVRVHFDRFLATCEWVPDPDAYIQHQIATHQSETRRLMAQVRELTARLAISPTPSLTDGHEVHALALRDQGQSMDAYKKALVLAKETTLPELFQAIETSNKALSRWMTAPMIPMKAQAKAMEPAIRAIKDRIFHVELYAGLAEDVEQIADGEPAPLTEPIRLFQRRAYMDEECLAAYETGGMEFADIRAFEAWLTRPEHLSRLLPFPRCVLAFRVRRDRKEREWHNLREFIRVIEKDDLDKKTFLYLRNGAQVFRLATAIEFDEKLFPDLDKDKLSGKTYAKVFGDHVERLISENEYLGMVEAEKREVAEAKAKAKKAKKEDRWQYRDIYRESKSYKPFTPDNVLYDDIAKFIQNEIKKHNRLVLVLQGLLDRSPVMHPHPPWLLWTKEGFAQALRLVYDDSRALVAGDKPDFEAYRAKLNASLRAGSVTIGQQGAWLRHEAKKESDKMDRNWRTARSDYRPTTYHPEGDPGPGVIAEVARYSPRAQKCTYTWLRARRKDAWRDHAPKELSRTFTVSASKVLNVDAYTPGDFKIFFADPRTRADYLKWAPLLLEAEEYHAGHRTKTLAAKTIARQTTEDGKWQYQRRKARKALLGKAVRLTRDIRMQSGHVYKRESLWRIVALVRGGFRIFGIRPDGTTERGQGREISCVESWSFKVDPSVPPEPKDNDGEGEKEE